jgi:hypothetical protein
MPGRSAFRAARWNPRCRRRGHRAARDRRGSRPGTPPCRGDRPLPVYTTVTGFVVTPVVGLVQPPFDLRIDTFEVAEAFEVPLQFLMTPAHHRRHAGIAGGGITRQFLSMPWPGNAHGELLHLGRHRGHAAQPLPPSWRRRDAGAAGYHLDHDELLRRPAALLVIEQLKPLPRDNWVHDTAGVLGGLDRPQLRRRPRRTMPGWCGACRCWRRPCCLGRCTCHRPLEPAAGAAFDVACCT